MDTTHTIIVASFKYAKPVICVIVICWCCRVNPYLKQQTHFYVIRQFYDLQSRGVNNETFRTGPMWTWAFKPLSLCMTKEGARCARCAQTLWWGINGGLLPQPEVGMAGPFLPDRPTQSPRSANACFGCRETARPTQVLVLYSRLLYVQHILLHLHGRTW
jgi:hypothetical protein